MSARALRTWRQQALYPSGGRPGRPAHDRGTWREALRAVREVLQTIGEVGWRVVYAALDGRHTRYVVQRVVAALKASRRRRVERRKRRDARHVEARRPGTVWSLDGTHLGRTDDGRAVDAQVLKDNGSRKVLPGTVGREACAEDVVGLLERAAEACGGWPLVLITDNGSPYSSQAVGEVLAEHDVLHVRNLPHTPQHNGACEQVHGELKREAGLGKGVRIASVQDAARRLEAARRRVNARPRAVLGWKTADATHRPAAPRYTAGQRKELLDAAQHAMLVALRGPGTARARRLAARRAALDTLEQYGIITQTRGSDARHGVKPEGIT